MTWGCGGPGDEGHPVLLMLREMLALIYGQGADLARAPVTHCHPQRSSGTRRMGQRGQFAAWGSRQDWGVSSLSTRAPSESPAGTCQLLHECGSTRMQRLQQRSGPGTVPKGLSQGHADLARSCRCGTSLWLVAHGTEHQPTHGATRVPQGPSRGSGVSHCLEGPGAALLQPTPSGVRDRKVDVGEEEVTQGPLGTQCLCHCSAAPAFQHPPPAGKRQQTQTSRNQLLFNLCSRGQGCGGTQLISAFYPSRSRNERWAGIVTY